MNKCPKCNGEMITIETGNTEIKTTFCKECGLIENQFYPHAREELIKKAVRAGEEKPRMATDEEIELNKNIIGDGGYKTS